MDGIRLIIERAKQHVRQVQAIVRQFVSVNRDCFVTERDPHTGQIALRIKFNEPIPAELAITAGIPFTT